LNCTKKIVKNWLWPSSKKSIIFHTISCILNTRLK
jgi:hypothetical protein